MARRCLLVSLLVVLLVACGNDPVAPDPPPIGRPCVEILGAETFTEPTFSVCYLRVRVRNPTSNSLAGITLPYNAFDSQGRGIGFTLVSGVVPPNSSQALEQIWTSPGAMSLQCSQIASFSLDTSAPLIVPIC